MAIADLGKQRQMKTTMNSLALASVWRQPWHRLAALTNRHVLMATIIAASGLIWLAPRLPLLDMPQQAGQLALWRDLILGVSPWSDLVRINLFTPYLIGFSLALPFSFVMPAGAAIQVVLTAAYFAFVISSIQLRKDFKADPRLDWLLVTPFFGFSWSLGFYTFLVAAPFGIQFIRLAHRHAEGRTMQTSLGLVGLGGLLIFCHGLVFLFAGFCGGVLLLAKRHAFARLPLLLAPYLVLGLSCIAYFVASRSVDDPMQVTAVQFGSDIATRVPELMLFLQGAFESDKIFIPLTLAMLVAPVVLGLQISSIAVAPLAAVMAIWFLAPYYAFDSYYLYQRFGMFIIPFFALMFASSRVASQTSRARNQCGMALMMAACWATVVVLAVRMNEFRHESTDFEDVMAAAEPGRRAYTIVLDPVSQANGHKLAYVHYPSWYQADKGGFVVCSFAIHHALIVRFRKQHVPRVNTCIDNDSAYDWRSNEGRLYEYFFVRNIAGSGYMAWADITNRLFRDADCAVRLVNASGRWALYRRGTCIDAPAPDARSRTTTPRP